MMNECCSYLNVSI